jgi:hypothetical protein
MSKLRSLNTIIWSDTWFEVLEPSAKLLFIYLVTNEKTNMLGVYEISIRKVSFETGIPEIDIKRYLKEFEDNNKIKYSENRVLLLNFLKHQNYNFNMMKSAIRTYNNLPLNLKINKINKLDETKEGFKTLCNGFSGVRKYEVEYEEEIELEKEVEVEEENTFHDINILKDYYLTKDKIVTAVINNKENKVKNLEDLKTKLDLFCKDLTEQGRLSETWKEFTSYFRNCLKLGKFEKLDTTKRHYPSKPVF